MHPCQAVVNKATGGVCGYSPEQTNPLPEPERAPLYVVQDDKEETRMDSATAANPLGASRVDVFTGELNPAQLSIMGIDVPSVRIQRKADLGMTVKDFNATPWDIRDGDRLTVQGKDGLLLVKLTKAWEQS
jgi:hypothetical protein